jgi:hypothetical protein
VNIVGENAEIKKIMENEEDTNKTNKNKNK